MNRQISRDLSCRTEKAYRFMIPAVPSVTGAHPTNFFASPGDRDVQSFPDP